MTFLWGLVRLAWAIARGTEVVNPFGVYDDAQEPSGGRGTVPAHFDTEGS